VAECFLSPELGFLPPLAAEKCNNGCHGSCSGVKVDGSRTTAVCRPEGWRGAAMAVGAGRRRLNYGGRTWCRRAS